jgi:hypothetical protein
MLNEINLRIGLSEWAFILLAVCAVIAFSRLTAHVYRRADRPAEGESAALKRARIDFRRERDSEAR